MSIKKIKVSAVSYTNTSPLMYGILRDSALLEQIDLSLDIPSLCAQKLIDGQVDLGLVPVAALLDIPNYEIVSDYCIGSIGQVNSVFIFSEKPLESVKTIRLDKQSRTSNRLAQVLLKNYWKLEVQFVQEGPADAFVEIGDRTFGKTHTQAYYYDLGQAWKDFSGLPFAYAVWAANKPIPQTFMQSFDQAQRIGLENPDAVLSTLPVRTDFDIRKYLTHFIQYPLDPAKREAIRLFHELIGTLDQ